MKKHATEAERREAIREAARKAAKKHREKVKSDPALNEKRKRYQREYMRRRYHAANPRVRDIGAPVAGKALLARLEKLENDVEKLKWELFGRCGNANAMIQIAKEKQ